MNKLSQLLLSGKNIVVITGAGISTLSGIPDFRGKNGLYTKGNNVEYMLSRDYFLKNPEGFYQYYKDNMIMKGIKPNIVHNTLAELEHNGLISCVITQNIDNLHQKAGSKNVIDIHGNGHKYYCTSCNESYSCDDYINSNICKKCGEIIRPDIVLYGECIDQDKASRAINAIDNADVLIVLGTSLAVSTAGSLVQEFIYNKGDKFKKDNLVIVNNQETPFDYCAYKIEDDLGIVFNKIRKDIIK